MFLVEGGLNFDTRNAIASARAFQREISKTGDQAYLVSSRAKDTENSLTKMNGAFSSREARGALRGLQMQLMQSKDATDLVISGAKAMQTALVKSIAGTAIIGAANVLSDSLRDVGRQLSSAADESSRVTKGFVGVSSSFEEGKQRADALAQSADNTYKALENLKNAGIFQSGVFKLFGGEKVLQDLDETTRSLSRAEFGAGAKAGKTIAERRVGMTPEQVAEDQRKEEEKKRLSEAKRMGGGSAEADVAATIAAENLTKERQKGAETAKKINDDIAQSNAKIAEMQKRAEEEKNQARINSLEPTSKIIELDKLAAKTNDELASVLKIGIYGTEEKRKAQLEQIEKLNSSLLDIEKQKAAAIKDQADEQERLNKKKQEELEKAIDIEIEENKRARESERMLQQFRSDLAQARQSVQKRETETQLQSFFGTDSWQQIPEYLRNQLVNGNITNKTLSEISRNTQKPQDAGYGFQEGGRYGRPSSGLGSRRPPGYIPEEGFGMRNIGDNGVKYKKTSVRVGNRVVSPDLTATDLSSLASAIQDLADKIPSAVPV